MTEQTRELFETMDSLKKDIENGDISESQINGFLRGLSEKEYRPIEEITVDYYIKSFSNGAKRTVKTDEKYWTARNAAREEEITDIAFYVEKFIKEDFMRVQKVFWDKYKKYKNSTIAIPAAVIYNTCKNLKSKLK